MQENFWIGGGVKSGKTQALIEQVRQWWLESHAPQGARQEVLLFAMNAENRSDLTQRLFNITAGQVPVRSTTPLGFFEEEVLLFWPLINGHLPLASLPLRLRPEMEQYLAVRFWGEEMLLSLNSIERFSVERWARNLLDVIQLAAFAGIPLEQVVSQLQQDELYGSVPVELWSRMHQCLISWRRWCYDHGFLTYGLVTDLYWQYLLPREEYQAQLQTRYALIAADDVETYPAIARDLFQVIAAKGVSHILTSNPYFSVREGLGADPNYLRGLEVSLPCKRVSLPAPTDGLGANTWAAVQQRLRGEAQEGGLPWDVIQTVTRSQLLRQTSVYIIQLVEQGVKPSDIAIIGPGLDSLARYALIEMLDKAEIPVASLKEQRPVNSSPLVRSLLTLLAFIFEGAGRLISPADVSEMMVVMTAPTHPIDFVRAGLLADYCYKPDLSRPTLLPLETFSRWDRMSAISAQGYRQLREWIAQQRSATQGGHLSPVDVISDAIAYFWPQQEFRFDQTAVLRELLETSQHFWQVYQTLDDQSLSDLSESHGLQSNFLAEFIGLVRRGTMTANPYPGQHQARDTVMLATAYQYRIARLTHAYQIWLDIGSPLWQDGSQISLWQAESFRRDPDDEQNANEERWPLPESYESLLQDLSYRATERIILAHSDLSVSGQEQMGILTALLNS